MDAFGFLSATSAPKDEAVADRWRWKTGAVDSECEESIASSGWQARGDHHGERVCACRSFKISQPTHPLLSSALHTLRVTFLAFPLSVSL
jgi:hypothetical protein